MIEMESGRSCSFIGRSGKRSAGGCMIVADDGRVPWVTKFLIVIKILGEERGLL